MAVVEEELRVVANKRGQSKREKPDANKSRDQMRIEENERARANVHRVLK